MLPLPATLLLPAVLLACSAPFEGRTVKSVGAEDSANGDDDSQDADRYAGGVVYTVTQGLTLRGSVQYVDADGGAGDDDEATAVLGGIQFNF